MKGIFIIDFEYNQLITNLFITYVIIFNKLTKYIKLACVYNIHIQIDNMLQMAQNNKLFSSYCLINSI